MLKQRGWQVIEGHCLRRNVKDKSADRSLRAKELSDFLCNAEINAVIPPWGGELAMELLELIDFELLAQREPKWLVGYSDISTLLFPLTMLAGWATAHGPNLMELGAPVLDATTRGIWPVLECERGTVIVQHASVAYQTDDKDRQADPDAGFILSQKTRWRRLDGSPDALRFQGRLIGGCLDSISRLAGTRFGDLPTFCKQHAGHGVILYFENVEMRPCELTRALISLRIHGWFDNVAGILIGRSAAADATDPAQLNYLDALQSALGQLNVPVLYDVDIGHVPPQFTLVNGALATVTFDGTGGSISQQL